MRHYILCVIPLLLAGCTIAAETPEQLSGYLTRHYLGRTANEFLYDNKHSYVFSEPDEDGHMYYWSSVRPSSTPPSDGNYVMADIRPAAPKHSCGIKVYTDKRDLIEEVVVVEDPMGE